MDVGPYTMEINVRVAALRHAQKDFVHCLDGSGNSCQGVGNSLRLLIYDCPLRCNNGLKRRTRGGFDSNMNEHKPLFILTAEKILQQDNIANLDRIMAIDSSPVVEWVGGVGEHRRAPEHPRHLMPRHGKG